MNEVLEKVKKLVEENEHLKEKLAYKEELLECYSDSFLEYQKLCDSLTAVAIFHHKKRGNTTIKFKDKSTVTVKKKRGDKDCLDTAIAWALAKHIYRISELKKIVQEVGG